MPIRTIANMSKRKAILNLALKAFYMRNSLNSASTEEFALPPPLNFDADMSMLTAIILPLFS